MTKKARKELVKGYVEKIIDVFGEMYDKLDTLNEDIEKANKELNIKELEDYVIDLEKAILNNDNEGSKNLYNRILEMIDEA